jgi:transcription-repair coupling factor (superfamily II helicase)
MKDLEIRGAGQILGAQQSGQIHAVGYELYSQLLTQAVDEAKAGGGIAGLPEEEPKELVLSLRLPARIPVQYVDDLTTRLSLYQRLSNVRSLDNIGQLQEEMWDRFGPLPRDVHNLMYTVRVRLLAQAAGVESVNKDQRTVTIRLRDDVGGAGPALERALGAHVRVGNRLLHLELRRLDRPWGQALLELLEGLAAFRERVAVELG